MMKLQRPLCLSLPLLLGACCLPAGAQAPALPPVVASVADTVAQAPRAQAGAQAGAQASPKPGARSTEEAARAAWEDVLGRRGAARLLSRRGEWTEAASEWRSVLLGLRRVENLSRLSAAPEREPAVTRRAELKREAEAEMKRAQSHLSAFWSVRDVVTPEVDSRNTPSASLKSPGLTPVTTPRATHATVASSTQAPALGASALARTSLGGASSSARKPMARGEMLVQRLISSRMAGTADAGTARLGARGDRGVALWAQEQWWTRPLVQQGVDSLNPAPLRLLPSQLAPLPGVMGLGPLAAWGEAPVSAVALIRAPRSFVFVAPTAPLPAATDKITLPALDAPVRTRRSWTMQIHLPSAREAAHAARLPLRSQP